MSSACCSPPSVPFGADQTMYVVIDNRGGAAARREVEFVDLNAAIADFLRGAFCDPVQIVAFNTLEHWSQDMSADVADEIQARCDGDAAPLPDHVRDFVNRHVRRACKAAR